jgi:hypothetical protein
MAATFLPDCLEHVDEMGVDDNLAGVLVSQGKTRPREPGARTAGRPVVGVLPVGRLRAGVGCGSRPPLAGPAGGGYCWLPGGSGA